MNVPKPSTRATSQPSSGHLSEEGRVLREKLRRWDSKNWAQLVLLALKGGKGEVDGIRGWPRSTRSSFCEEHLAVNARMISGPS